MRVSLVILFVLAWAPVFGQPDPDHVLSLTPAQMLLGTEGDSQVLLDSTNGVPLAGWAWGVCHDTPLFDIVTVADGVTTLTVNGGTPPAFNSDVLFPGEGWTSGVIIN